MSDKYAECPLKAAGFALHRLPELGTVPIGPDGSCICTVGQQCLDVDKRDGKRCSLDHLVRLSDQAVRRRAWQSGKDW